MEIWLTAGAFFVALLLAAWRGSQGVLCRADRLLERLGRSNLAASITIATIALTTYALPSLWHIPAPVVHDEFAYLLQGDTFAHGRLTNPSHPLSSFFETFHVLQAPTYQAKFPPGTGLFLGLGFRLGLPIAGIWISVTLGCLAIFWMLRAVMPPRWALIAAILASVHPTIIWFSQTYWGGSVPMIGGALLGGAFFRAVRKPDLSQGMIAGLGMGILAISRPLEGLLVSIVCGFALLICACRDGQARLLVTRFVPAAIAIPMLVGGWLMYYNWRITEHPLLMPYALHTSRYMSAPLFFWQGPPATPASYPNEQMRQFHTGVEFAEYTDEIGYPNYPLSFLSRGGMIVWAYMRPMILLLPLIVSISALSRRRNVILSLAICAAVMTLHMTICPWMRIAYMAPLFGWMLVLIGHGLWRLEHWRMEGQPVGRALARAIVLGTVIVGLFNLVHVNRDNAASVFSKRDQILASLDRQGGTHLIFVRYGASHSPTAEWVYNAADIDTSKAIFARDLGEGADYELLSQYPQRTAWLLEITNRDVRLRSFAAQPEQPITPVASPDLRPVAE